jgi:predicted nucleic acid-binding protein
LVVVASSSIPPSSSYYSPPPLPPGAATEYALVAEVAESSNPEKGGGSIGLGSMSAPSTSTSEDDGIVTVAVDDEDPSEKTGLNPFNVGRIFTGYPDANEFEDGVQAASLGSQLAFTLAVVLLVIITGGTLYVSAREAMDRKEESDAREEMERQERIVEANKGKLNQAANKRRKPKVSNLDKLVAEGIIEPGSANAASKKKLNRKDRREQQKLTSSTGDANTNDEDEDEDFRDEEE